MVRLRITGSWLFLLCCFVFASCNYPDTSGETNRSNPPSNTPAQAKKRAGVPGPPPINWLGAKNDVDRAAEILTEGRNAVRQKPVASPKGTSSQKKDVLPSTPPARASINKVFAEIAKAREKLPKNVDEVGNVCSSCGEAALSKTESAVKLLEEIAQGLDATERQRSVELSGTEIPTLRQKLNDVSKDLGEANTAYSEFAGSRETGADNAVNSGNVQRGQEQSWLDLIWPIAGGLAAAGLIVLVVFGVLRMRKGYWAKLDDHVNELVKAHVTGVKRRQDDLNKQLSTALHEQQRTSGRLESIEGELQALGRRIRQGADGGFGGGSMRQAFDEYSRLTPHPIEPEFPASVNEYLDKKRRTSTVVKPDFQNGILVNDIDGKGELVLIRDASVPDDAQPLFVVPRVAQFQTKQEFHSYYERYYECQRPSAGDIWIIDPAVVSTVPGGWQLREKGVLEVR